MPLALRGEQAPGPVERHVVADRRQDVVELLVLRARVAHAVGGEQRQAQPPREIHERLVAVLLLAQVMALELDVDAPGKDRRELLELFPRRVEPAARQRPRDRPLVAARQHVEPLRVRGDLVPRDARLALRLSERARRDEAAEVPVAGAVLDEEGELAVSRPSPRGGGAGEGGIGVEPLLGERVHERPSPLPSPAGRRRSIVTSAPTIARTPAAFAAL